MKLDTVGGRKFVMVLGCGFVTTLLCWFGKISGDVYAETIKWTVGAFVTGTAFERIAPYLQGGKSSGRADSV